MLADLVAVGEVMLDVELSELALASRRHAGVRVRAGGSAVNVALAAHVSGLSTAVVGRVGDDVAGDAIESELRRAGVISRLVRDPEEPTGTFVFAPVEETAVANRGANARFAAEDVPQPLVAGVVIVSGYLLLYDDSRAGASAAFHSAEADWIAVDAASAELVSRTGGTRFYAETKQADMVFANADTALALTGAPPTAAAAELGRRFRIAVVTAGAAGAVVSANGRTTTIRPPRLATDSTVGAGDRFAAGMLAALARGAEPQEAARAAAAQMTSALASAH